MKVTKEGIYRDSKGMELPVFDVGWKDDPYFRAYSYGGYYNVNLEKDYERIEWEMVEFVRDFRIDENGYKT